MKWARSAVGVFFCCVLSSNARADQDLLISVTRGSGTDDCPDAGELTGRVAAIRGGPVPDTDEGYRVSFTREGERVSAVIRPTTGRGARFLHATGLTCTALAKATAVTLALLLDSHSGLENAQESSEAPPAPDPAADPVLLPPDLTRRVSESGPRGLTASVGGAAVFGVVSPIAPGLLAEVGLRVHRLRTSVGALWLPPRESELGPGTVRASLFSGVVRGCFVPWLSEVLELGACSGALIGVVMAEGTGYTQDEQRNKPWIAVPVELSLAHLAGPVGVELGAAALIALRRYDFTVNGLGVAYRSLPVGVFLSLRGYWLWSW